MAPKPAVHILTEALSKVLYDHFEAFPETTNAEVIGALEVVKMNYWSYQIERGSQRQKENEQ